MNSASTFPFCVYTILHTDKLNEIFEKGGNGKFKEGKKWVTAEKMFSEARANKMKLLILFAPAERTLELIYHAVVESIKIDSESGITTVKFAGLIPFKPKRPKKASLILRSTKTSISPDFIRPYAICKTPVALLKTT